MGRSAKVLRRKCACGGTCEACTTKPQTVRRKSAPGVKADSGVPAVVEEVLRTPGQALDGGTRARLEPRLGHDFSGVRLHVDAKAAESARAVGALAYTVGRDVVFADGQYAPGTGPGSRLLAHELTHVGQAGGAAWDRASPLRLGGHDADEQQAERASTNLQAAAPPGPSAAARPGRAATVRRQAGPTDDAAKSAGPPGLEGPDRALQDKAAIDALSTQPQPPGERDQANEKKLTDALGVAVKAFFKTSPGKRLADVAAKEAEKLPTVVEVTAPLALLGAAVAGLAATKGELPVTESPEIPFELFGVKMKAKGAYKGPLQKPTEASFSLTLTFAKGSLEVTPAFKATWQDTSKPAGPDNSSAIEGGLLVKYPIAPDAASTGPSDTEKVRADLARRRAEDAKFRAGMSWMPGTPEARAAEQEKRAISDFAMKPWAPRAMAPSSGDPGGPRILQSFDVKRGPGKQPWNLDRLARLISEAFAASPGATLMVLATYAAGAGDSEEGRRASGENRDAAAENAEVVSRALAEWMPIPKGRISTSIEAKDTGRTFGLPAEAAGELGAREVSVIVLPR